MLAVVIGRLQALVDATPQRIGNSYLRCLYDSHVLEARRDDGRLDYYLVIKLNPLAWQNGGRHTSSTTLALRLAPVNPGHW
jgi:hypothetical protein